MSKTYSPERLDIAAFAHARGELAGEAPLAQFARLVQEVQSQTGALPAATTPPVHWRARGHERHVPGGAVQPALHLTLHATVPLTCQRCLQALAQAVTVERGFLFVADEQTAAALDEELDDDVLVLSQAFDLYALIEDELLLALPLVPRHEACPEAPPLAVQDADFDAAQPTRPNPFAVLAGLSLSEGKADLADNGEKDSKPPKAAL